MKKILVLLFVCFIGIVLFATPMTGSIGVGETQGSKSTTLEYSLKTEKGSTDNYRVGFTTRAVTDFSEQTSASNIQMEILEGSFIGTIPDGNPVYLYWQIDSSYSTEISLTASTMELSPTESGANNFLNVTLKTEAGSGTSNESEDGTTIKGVSTSAQGSVTDSQVVLNYNTTEGGDFSSTKQCAGSQKIILETESIYGKTDGIYTGTLTATIKTYS